MVFAEILPANRCLLAILFSEIFSLRVLEYSSETYSLPTHRCHHA
jgi:hypothetical protein